MNIAYMPNKYYTFATDVKAAERRMIMTFPFECPVCGHKTNMPQTNADQIRAMSDEDLANLLTDYSNNSGWVTEIGREICFERIYEWLQQSAE